MKKDMNIGFIGTGVMGKSMARNLQKAGFQLHIFTRTKAKAQSIIDHGAIWHHSIPSLVKASRIIITMVGYPQDVEEVYLGSEGIITHATEGTYAVDMTTSKPSLAIEIYEQAIKKSIYTLDAPVSGGDIGAQNGTLTIMVGGEVSVFNKLLPIFNVLGDNVILQGDAGAGQHTKLANQITIASNMIGVCEAIMYTKKAGLDPTRVLESISTGAAGSWSLSHLAPRMIQSDYEPGFFVKHFIKDMTIAIESAKEIGLSTPGLSLSLKLYEELADSGESNSGTQALIKLFEK